MKQNLDFILRSNVDPYKIMGMATSFPPNSRIDYSDCGREGHILHVTLNGEREYIVNGEKQHLDAHSVIFIPDGTKYITKSIAPEGEMCEGISVKFWLAGEPERSIPKGVFVHQSHAGSRLEREFLELDRVFTREPALVLKQKELLLGILARFIEKYTASHGMVDLVAPAIEYISRHYRENEPIAKYAAVCNMSESYFRKKFQQATGTSPITYRNSLRFAEARKLYREGLTMKAIAERLGFCDENYLSKLYKRENGTNLRDDAGFI